LIEVLAALGSVERELAVGDVAPDKRWATPISGLSSDWLTACYDGSPEFRLARAVASIQSPASGKVPRLRAYLEPVEPVRRGWAWIGSDQAKRASRSPQDRPRWSVVWSGSGLTRNFGAVLTRRLLDAERAGEELLPLFSPQPASLFDIARFLEGNTDDSRLEDLLWGCTLAGPAVVEQDEEDVADDSGVLPRVYALLKLTVLPGRIDWKDGPSGTVLRHTRHADADGEIVRPDAAMFSRLRAGDVAGACEIAVRRLRATGFTPLPGSNADGSRRDVFREFTGPPDRLLASLLFPITDDAVNTLAQMVLRRPANTVA
jgi:CRISPR-associated protein Csx17